MLYAFSAHVVIMFYVPYTQGNRLVTIRVSPDVSKNIVTQEKGIFSVWPKSNVDEAQIHVEISKKIAFSRRNFFFKFVSKLFEEPGEHNLFTQTCAHTHSLRQ